MLSYDNAAAIAAAPEDATEPELKELLADRVHDWAATDLLGLTHLLIVQAGDAEQDIVDEVGFSPLVSPIDGARFGSPQFHPHHDWLEQHVGWTELTFCIGNDGWACVMFVQDADGADPELLALCRGCADGGE